MAEFSRQKSPENHIFGEDFRLARTPACKQFDPFPPSRLAEGGGLAAQTFVGKKSLIWSLTTHRAAACERDSSGDDHDELTRTDP